MVFERWASGLEFRVYAVSVIRFAKQGFRV